MNRDDAYQAVASNEYYKLLMAKFRDLTLHGRCASLSDNCATLQDVLWLMNHFHDFLGVYVFSKVMSADDASKLRYAVHPTIRPKTVTEYETLLTWLGFIDTDELPASPSDAEHQQVMDDFVKVKLETTTAKVNEK